MDWTPAYTYLPEVIVGVVAVLVGICLWGSYASGPDPQQVALTIVPDYERWAASLQLSLSVF